MGRPFQDRPLITRVPILDRGHGEAISGPALDHTRSYLILHSYRVWVDAEGLKEAGRYADSAPLPPTQSHTTTYMVPVMSFSSKCARYVESIVGGTA